MHREARVSLKATTGQRVAIYHFIQTVFCFFLFPLPDPCFPWQAMLRSISAHFGHGVPKAGVKLYNIVGATMFSATNSLFLLSKAELLLYVLHQQCCTVSPQPKPGRTLKNTLNTPNSLTVIIIPSNEMKIFDWLTRIQHLKCYCQQIFQSTTSGFITMNSNVEGQKGTMANTTDAQHHQMLYLQMQVTLQMLHLRTQVTL